MICLYRRNHRLDPKKCFYRKYLCSKNQQFHKRFIFAENDKNFPEKDECTHQKLSLHAKNVGKEESKKYESFYSPGFEKFFEKRFQKYYDDEDVTNRQRHIYHVNNDNDEKNLKFDIVDTSSKTKSEKDEEKLNLAFSNITKIIGELELQIGIECARHGLFAVRNLI